MRRWLPLLLLTTLTGCVLPAWPPPWADDDDTTDIADDDDSASVEVVWKRVDGDEYLMGTDGGATNESPVHSVLIPTFEMMRTEVTIEQYRACLDAGVCSPPEGPGDGCIDVMGGYPTQPVACVTWTQAHTYCAWIDARLPSESEWEFAARSRGLEVVYPRGDTDATCVYAVMYDAKYGGTDDVWVVCSKEWTGNTEQDLCDMAGNVSEWVQDWYHTTYHGAPADGTAWEDDGGTLRVTRGGSCSNDADRLRAACRGGSAPDWSVGGLGFRCVREPL